MKKILPFILFAAIVLVLFFIFNSICLNGMVNSCGNRPIIMRVKVDFIVDKKVYYKEVEPFVVFDKTDFLKYLEQETKKANNYCLNLNEHDYQPDQEFTFLYFAQKDNVC